MAERSFGVEIECGIKGADRYGGQAEYRVREGLRERGAPFLSVGSDGSGAEVRTRPLVGDSGWAELEKVFAALNDMGCFVKTPPDGQHIHIQAPEYCGKAGTENRKRFIESFVNNREHILQFVSNERWTDFTNVSPDWVRVVEHNKHHVVLGSKGWDINMRNLGRARKTIEIRLHEGNLDFEKARAWITFWQNMIDAVVARKTPFPAFKDNESLFRATKSREQVKAKLKAASASYDRRNAVLPKDAGNNGYWRPNHLGVYVDNGFE